MRMPCWYYDKKDLRNTPSCRDGIELEIESRYRREGARFIIDVGTKLGLRYDSCATGVVFFHRFYMFHSFKDFNRYVSAACCLFLAGKTEETPKKCKDLIKVTKDKLTDAQFLVFGDDPKEEVMTMERILLQTIKFDLMVEHPYAFLLRFAKLIKEKAVEADKAKIQKMVQMSWTFINDSMCTTLCLQWEPEVVAISLMYLASRLTKTDVTDWQGKPLGYKKKWFEFLVEDVNLELLEDVCHQVLDLYSSGKVKEKDDTPPPPPPPKVPHPSIIHSATKRPRSPTPVDTQRSHSGGSSSSKHRDDKRPPSPKDRSSSKHAMSRSSSGGSNKTSRQTSHSSSNSNTPISAQPGNNPQTPYSKSNPYMPQQMYSSSFMTQEGSQSIQSLVGGKTQTQPTGTYPSYPQQAPAATTVNSTTYATPPPGYPQQQQATYQQPAAGYQQPYTQTGQTTYTPSTSYSSQYPYPPPGSYPQGSQYPATTTTFPQQSYTQPPTQAQQAAPQPQQAPPQPQQSQQYPGTAQQYSQQYPGYSGQSYPNYTATQDYQPPAHPPPPTPPAPPRGKQSSLTTVRITGRTG